MTDRAAHPAPPRDEYTRRIVRLFRLSRPGMKLGLTGTRRALEILGDPHRAFRSVHVAGTNGKGSVAAFLESILLAAGERAGLYTSPHLVDMRERFRVDRALVPKTRVVSILRALEPHYPSLTFFETTTALAFRLFADARVETAVVEVGLGGRLDSTNVLLPDVSVITAIDLDHTDVLGGDLVSIAREKAGVIKPGVPIVCGERKPRIKREIMAVAGGRRAPFIDATRARVRIREESIDGTVLDARTDRASYEGLHVPLAGRHQVRNAMCAVAAAEALAGRGHSISDDRIRSGLADARWDGRLQVLERDPLVICDVAHNPAGCRVIAEALARLLPARRAVCVYGGLAKKDHRANLRALSSVVSRFVFVRPPTPLAVDPNALLSFARGRVVEDVGAAVRGALRGLRRGEYVLVAGSHYVVGAYYAHRAGVPPSPA